MSRPPIELTMTDLLVLINAQAEVVQAVVRAVSSKDESPGSLASVVLRLSDLTSDFMRRVSEYQQVKSNGAVDGPSASA